MTDEQFALYMEAMNRLAVLLEEIKDGIIDVETEIQNQNKILSEEVG